MRLGCEDDHRKPTTEAGVGADPLEILKSFQLGDHDLRFVDTVAGRPAGHRFGGTGVDAKLVVDDGPGDATGDKRVPVAVDNVRETAGERRV